MGGEHVQFPHRLSGLVPEARGRGEVGEGERPLVQQWKHGKAQALGERGHASPPDSRLWHPLPVSHSCRAACPATHTLERCHTSRSAPPPPPFPPHVAVAAILGDLQAVHVLHARLVKVCLVLWNRLHAQLQQTNETGS